MSSSSRSDSTTKTIPTIRRRDVLSATTALSLASLLCGTGSTTANVANAAATTTPMVALDNDEIVDATKKSSSSSSTTENAKITDQIYITIKGLPGSSSTADGGTTTINDNRIVIGLFGKDAPECVGIIKQLVSNGGYPALCRPKAIRTLQKEQLEANKVYNACMERQDSEGVSLKYSTIWRIIPNERIDMGAVTGKYVAREYPNYMEKNDILSYRHDVPGIVSVRRGNQGGFGFTIYPGGSKDTSVLDEDHIVIGRVIQGMDIVNTLNTNVPIITSSSVNYMSLTGGGNSKNGPDRSCRYGGPMYCNEYKPLIKLTLSDVGLIK